MTRRLALTLLLAAGFAAAETPSATVRLEPAAIPFTAPAVLTVELRHAAGETPQFGPVADLDGALTVRAPEIERRTEKESAVTTLRCVIEGLEEGRFALRPLTVTWADGAREDITLPGVHVRPLTEAESEAAAAFAESFGMLEAPQGGGAALGLWLAAAAGVLVGAAAMAYWLLRRRRVRSAEPPRAPWEVAYGRLAALERAGYAERGAADAFYVQLSDIARQYIEARLAIHAPERTTPEFLHEASSSGKLRAEHEAMLARFMRRADRVKFARYVATAEEMAESFQDIRRFIDETVPKVQDENGREAAA